MTTPPRTVLCADDDPDDRDLICEAIKDVDPSLRIVHASDGLEAHQYLIQAKEKQELPCLIILDINMPKLDGKQTLIKIKKDTELNKIPVILFTTSNSSVDKTFCEHYGAELITKPSYFRNFTSEVERMLQYCSEDI